MTTQEQKDLEHLERSLFFSKERILRWMRKTQGENTLHPEMDAYEEQQVAQKQQSFLNKLL